MVQEVLDGLTFNLKGQRVVRFRSYIECIRKDKNLKRKSYENYKQNINGKLRNRSKIRK